MLVRYGKNVDMRYINRNIRNINEITAKAKKVMETYYPEHGGGGPTMQDMRGRKGSSFYKAVREV